MATRKKFTPTKIFVALDVDKQKTALSLAKKLKSPGVGFKIGPRLVNRYGASFVKKIAKFGPVFIDLKFFDIPSTMVAAVQAAFDSGASFATIHALSGPKAMNEMAKLEKELNKKRPFKVLAVTVLTSFDEKSLPYGLWGQKIGALVTGLAKDVVQSGLTGIVCSPFEAKAVRALSGNITIVTPGIRGPADKADDQSRTMNSVEAMAAGATALVVGRPILQSKKPRQTLADILQDLTP